MQRTTMRSRRVQCGAHSRYGIRVRSGRDLSLGEVCIRQRASAGARWWYLLSIDPNFVNEHGERIVKHLLSVLIAFCFVPAALAASTPIVEVFGCKLKEGRTMADFDRAAAAWAAQADKLPANASYFAAILKPYRGATMYDVVWIGSNPTMDDWANAGVAGMASASETAALAGIEAVTSCESGLFAETTLYDGLKEKPGDVDAVIESFVCSLKPGKTMKDADAYDAAVVNGSKALKLSTYSQYRYAPLYDRRDVQVAYLIVNDDLEAFAKGFDAWNDSKEGQAANAAAASALSCDAALWLGHVIHQPTTPSNH